MAVKYSGEPAPTVIGCDRIDSDNSPRSPSWIQLYSKR